MAAFDKALAMGCQFVEFDVMCNAEGKAYVFHDEKLKRTSDGRGLFSLASSEYLDSLDAGKWFSRRFKGEKIPRFSELLQWLSFSDVQANIEIKPCEGTTEQTTICILSEINRYWPQKKPLPLVSSFDWQALSLCRSITPEIPMGLLMDEWDEEGLKLAKQLNCISIHLNRRILNEERVTAMKEQGFLVCAYTVNRKRQAKKLFSWGVDAVFSDYPDLIS